MSDSILGEVDKEGDNLHESMCILVKADEIRADKELMKKLDPYMEEHADKVKKVVDMKTFHRQALADALAAEDEEKKVGKDYFKDSKEEDSKNQDESGLDKKELSTPKK